MVIDVKLCWLCRHFNYTQAEPDWSEVTPGSDFSMYCSKHHWSFDSYKTSQEEFGEMLSTALNCKDFVPLASIK